MDVISSTGNVYPSEGGTATRDYLVTADQGSLSGPVAGGALPDGSGAVITQALKDLKSRQDEYALHCDYYDGRHKLTFATEKFRSAFGFLFRTFADNLCPAVVDAVADKLEVTGFGTDDDAASDDPSDPGEQAWKLWQQNRMDERAGEVHQEACKTGNGYVIVWPDAGGAPVIYPNTSDMVTVKYDPETPGKLLWAAKIWAQDDGTLRCTLYFPDRLEKYVTRQKYDGSRPDKGDLFEPYCPDGEPWPVPNPWCRVPVFHLAANAGVGKQGRSDLVNAIPVQNALNKSLCDMLVGMEFAALPQRWATGLEIPTDPETGAPKQMFKAAVDRLWSVPSEDTRFGEFGTANLEQFLKVADSFRMSMARNTATPLTYMMLMTDPPSGEALKTLESRATKKCQDRQTSFGNVWEDVMLLALRMARKAPILAVQLAAKWKDAAPKSETEEVNNQLVKQQLGVSKRQSLKELGYGDQEITDMLVEAAQESADAGAAAMTAFNAGQSAAMPGGKGPVMPKLVPDTGTVDGSA